MPPIAVDNLTGTTEASISPSKATVIVIDEDGLVSDATVDVGAHTAIFNRVPWRPPVAVKGEGIYLDLEDGTRIIDGVGGAAVTCIGGGHPKVAKAIRDQLQELVCTSMIHLISQGLH
jgi:4-aminobutyrate aminotransferase-like enzyme